jgi:hypothetical protein
MGSGPSKNTSHIRHLAFQILAQLPEETAEALEVLKYAARLVQQTADSATEPITLKLVDRQGD